MKKLLRVIILLAVILTGISLWITRPPTTELLDASGKTLTAGHSTKHGVEEGGGALFEAVNSLIAKKEFVAAKAALLEIVDRSDRDGEACILLCQVCRELKEADAAVDYGLKAVQILPDRADAHLAYAEALGFQMFSNLRGIGGMLGAMTRLGPFRKALARVIELDPADTKARSMLVFLNMAPKPIGQIDKAIELCGEIELHDPVLGKQLLATCYQRKEETERAIQICLDAIAEHPDAHSIHVTLGDIYAQEKRFDEADAAYESGRLGDRDEAYYRSLYAQARMRIHNEFEPERTIAWLDEFIAAEPEGETVPSVAHACWRKGNALEQLGKTHDALLAYKESLRHDPDLEEAKESVESLEP